MSSNSHLPQFANCSIVFAGEHIIDINDACQAALYLAHQAHHRYRPLINLCLLVLNWNAGLELFYYHFGKRFLPFLISNGLDHRF